MVCPSFLRFIPQSSEAVPIHWSGVPENSKQYFLDSWVHDRLDEVDEDTASEDSSSEEPSSEGPSWEEHASYWQCQERALPWTFGGLVEFFHGAKFIGNFGSELVQLFVDIGYSGLEPEKSVGHGHPIGPRFYMKYESQLWFLLFAPGEKEGGFYGFSANLPDVRHGIEDWDAAEAAEAEKDREVAEIFDKKLVDDVSRLGGIQALFPVRVMEVKLKFERLAGWDAFTFKSCLMLSELADLTMILARDDPEVVKSIEEMKKKFGPWIRILSFTRRGARTRVNERYVNDYHHHGASLRELSLLPSFTQGWIDSYTQI